MSGKIKPPNAVKCKQKIVALYASRRRIADLAKAFGPSKASIADRARCSLQGYGLGCQRQARCVRRPPAKALERART